MNKICDEIILYEISKYLDITNKCKLRLVNKNFYKLQTQAIYFHIGNIIANNIGFDHECKLEYKILQNNNFEILQDISDFLLKEKKCIFGKIFSDYKIPIGLILKIYSSNIEDCQKKLKEKNIFRINNLAYKKNINKISYQNTYILKKYINVYAII